MQNSKRMASQREALRFTDSLQIKQDKGIDFTATGNFPTSWKLTLSYHDSIRFQANDGLSFIMPTRKSKESSDAETIFTGDLQLGKIEVRIQAETCSTDGNPNTTVAVNNLLYRGCGSYLYDYLLNDKWILTQYDGKTVEKNHVKNAIAFLQFDLIKSEISGSDGCNGLSGPIEIQGEYIKFGPILSTLKACKNTSTAGFQAKLSNFFIRYRIEKQKLYLYLLDDSMLIFEKES